MNLNSIEFRAAVADLTAKAMTAVMFLKDVPESFGQIKTYHDLEEAISHIVCFLEQERWDVNSSEQYSHLQKILSYQDDKYYIESVKWLNNRGIRYPLDVSSADFRALCQYLLDVFHPAIPQKKDGVND